MTRLRSTIAAALLVGVALIAPGAAHAAEVDAVAPSAHLTLVLDPVEDLGAAEPREQLLSLLGWGWGG